MAKRIITKIGDVFCTMIDNNYKCYFQFIAKDMSLLNSSTIRVFKRHYPIYYETNIDEIIHDDVSFYSHTVLSVGIRLGYWEKVGKHNDIGHPEDVIFRMTDDFGPCIPQKSYRWYVWRINEPYNNIGELTEEYRNAEIGMVFSCKHIVNRIKTGYYDDTHYPE